MLLTVEANPNEHRCVQELALRGKELVTETFRSFEVYTVVTLVYVVMTLMISGFLKLLGRRLFRRPA